MWRFLVCGARTGPEEGGLDFCLDVWSAGTELGHKLQARVSATMGASPIKSIVLQAPIIRAIAFWSNWGPLILGKLPHVCYARETLDAPAGSDSSKCVSVDSLGFRFTNTFQWINRGTPTVLSCLFLGPSKGYTQFLQDVLLGYLW